METMQETVSKGCVSAVELGQEVEFEDGVSALRWEETEIQGYGSTLERWRDTESEGHVSACGHWQETEFERCVSAVGR